MQAKRSVDRVSHALDLDGFKGAERPVSLVSARSVRIVLAVATGLVVANCSSPSQKIGRGGVDPKYGVSPSPKMVADGDPVPKGGGRDLVGKPYVVAGRLYTPREMTNYSAVGTASWYGPSFHGRMTANGEVFDRNSVSVAHPTMPLPSYVRVTNTANGRSIIARVNDRGPYHGNRLVDVSERVAHALAFRHIGTARVRVDYVGRASTSGSDDEKLFATLRTDGAPARMRGDTMFVASAEPEQAPAAPSNSGINWPIFGSSPAQAAPVAAAAPVPMQVATPVAAAPAISIGKPAPGVPLPPDRPFDLGASGARPFAVGPSAAPVTAPGGMTAPAPVLTTVPMPIPRTVLRAGTLQTASLFFAPLEPELTQTFRQADGKADPMGALIQQNFVPLKSARAAAF